MYTARVAPRSRAGAITATRIGDREVDIDGQRVALAVQLIRFTPPFNETGYPAGRQARILHQARRGSFG